MRFRMDSRTDLVVLVEIILCVTSSSPATFDSHLLPGDHISPLGYYPPGLSPEDLVPDFYAYTEVNTPLYHYHFYAPAFKTSSEDSHLVPSSQSYPWLYKPFRTEDKVYIQRNGNPTFPSSFGNPYVSPRVNDVYRSIETSPYNRKLYGNPFLQKPYSTTFGTYETDSYLQKPASGLSQSFLPSVLSSGTTNIIRKDDEGRTIHDRMFRPYSSSKDHEPNTVFEPEIRSYKPVLNPSLFSSASPNIIRGEVPSVNKLFTPVSKTTNNNLSSSKPNSRAPSYSYTPQITLRGEDPYHTFTSVSSSTPQPFLFQTSEFPGYSSPEETIIPLFTSTQTPLEDYPTPGTVDGGGPQLYQEASTVAPPTTRLLFEAPGHSASP